MITWSFVSLLDGCQVEENDRKFLEGRLVGISVFAHHSFYPKLFSCCMTESVRCELCFC